MWCSKRFVGLYGYWRPAGWAVAISVMVLLIAVLGRIPGVSTGSVLGATLPLTSLGPSTAKMAPPPVIRFVDLSNNISGDGTSWATAFKTIQEGIDAVEPYGLGEVWVAQGIYNEARTSTPHGDGVNTGSVVMKPGVHLYGGFTGHETIRGQRDWNLYPTIISGSASRGGLPAFHVVVGADASTLDGFYVTGGDGRGQTTGDEGSGGGMFNKGVSPTITNCVFQVNKAEFNAGMANGNGASPVITDCVFTANTSNVNAAGMGNWTNCNPVVTRCIFSANIAGRMGGGLFDGDGSSSTITNCIFKDNSGVNVGGGIANYQNGLSKVTNCVFINNTVSGASWGGGGIGAWQSSPTIMNCSFTLNSGAGSAVYSDTDSTLATNCVLWGDNGAEVKGIPTILYSDVQGGHAGTGNIDLDPMYMDPANHDLQLQWGSPCIDAGTGTGAPSADYLGTLRPSGAGIDMGAYEVAVASIRGVVRDADTGQPLTCAAVVLSSASKTTGQFSSADLNGRYCIGNLPPDVYTLRAYAPGYAPQLHTLTVPAGVTGWSFSLTSAPLTGGVRGVCTDRDYHQPVAGVRVDAYIGFFLAGSTYTGACGRYELSGLVVKSGTDITLEFSSEGYETVEDQVNVPPGGTSESNQEMAPKSAIPGAVAGVITDHSTGLPLQGARVSAEGLGSVSADTDATGVYTLAALPEGEYTFVASATGYEGQSRSEWVSSGMLSVDFSLRSNAAAPPEDVNADNTVNAVDVQLVINAALTLLTGYDCDVDCDNCVNAVDVQKVINCALGL
ncbi:MAG: carboxypeptidase regulatory-like domain-containing protein [Candidatus Hydrogenedentes bacterium]|nr:carboxypeptidase regulatory-like domain-containing protein [Candidatus Hydrogenedentota bacterium]